jgi:aminopeptidase N
MIRVWTPFHQLKQAQYALKVATRILPHVEKLFGIPYALPKLDLIYLPDYKPGAAAMENWGLVTFSQRSLLYDKNLSTGRHKQRVTAVITHEIAHQ